MTKHEEEVRFLEAAAGLEMTIIQTQGEINRQQQQHFSSPPMALLPPQKPVPPRKPSGMPPTPPTEKVPITFHASYDVHSIQNPFHVLSVDGFARGFNKEKSMFERHELPIKNYGVNKDSDILEGNAITNYDLSSSYFSIRIEDAIIPIGSCPRLVIGKAMKHNKTVRAIYEKHNAEAPAIYAAEMQVYEGKMREYEAQMRQHEALMAQYEQQMAEYERNCRAHGQRTAELQNSWQAIKNGNIQTLTAALNDAQQQLENLYASTRILPKPYQYPEAVFYLYEFLSSSSDDYDIKYALERVDANEMKRLMAAMIQNQSRQAQLMASIMTSVKNELSRLGDTAEQQLSVSRQQASATEQQLSAMERQLSVSREQVSAMERQASLAGRQLSVAAIAM